MNRLKDETSPYLLQHAENPVDWYPWGDEAFARAREEGKPIFLSIGYSACHWCHVMERESFSVPETAELMNENFVCIKVDREERPDIDSLYMDVAVAINGSGGWPLNVFLRADGKPFWAATYLPPEPRHDLRSFRDVLTTAADAWRDKREELEASSESLTDHIRKLTEMKPVDAPVDEELIGAGDREHHLLVRLGVGRLGARTEVSRGERARVPLPAEGAADDREDARRDGGGRHVRPRRRRLPPLLGRPALARAALREDALRQRAARRLLPPRLPDDTRRAVPAGRRADDRLHAAGALARRRRARLLAGRRHRRQGGDQLHLDAHRGRHPRPDAPHVRGRPLHPPRRARRGQARRALRAARAAAEAAARRQGDRVLERARAGGARRVRAGARAGGLGRRGLRARRVPARAALDARRPPPPHLARRHREGHGLPRGLRERRERAARAARRDRRAALARGGEPPRPARGRALLRRGGRRLLPDAERRRGARDPQEGLRRPPGAERELDDRLRPAAAVADLRRRRPRGEGGLGVQARARRACRTGRRRSAGGSSRSTSISRSRARSRSSGRSTRRSCAGH